MRSNVEILIQNCLIALTQKNNSTERRFPRRSFWAGHFKTKVKGLLIDSFVFYHYVSKIKTTTGLIFRPSGRI